MGIERVDAKNLRFVEDVAAQRLLHGRPRQRSASGRVGVSMAYRVNT